jgi:hypothetical protein
MAKIYEIVWYDAHFNSGVMPKKSIKHETKPYIIKSVGYFAGSNKIDFKVAQEIHDSGQYGHIISIPHSAIIKKRILTEA